MKVIHHTNIEEKPVNMEGAKDTFIRWLITSEDGAPNFAMRLFRVLPGGYTPYHNHPYEHEVFVLEGEGKLVFEGNEYELKPGFIAYVDPDRKHQFVNTSKDKELKFICVIPYK